MGPAHASEEHGSGRLGRAQRLAAAMGLLLDYVCFPPAISQDKAAQNVPLGL